MLSKNFPGTIYVFDAESGDKISSIDLMLESEKPVPISLFSLTDITIDKPGLSVFFLSNSPYRFYNYSLLENKVAYFDLKETFPQYTGGIFTLAPKNINESQVSFVSSKSIVYIFDLNNIATYITNFSFASKYPSLNQISSGGTVPYSASSDYFYTEYQNYMCSFAVVSSIENTCKIFVSNANRESTELVNPINIEDDVAFLFSKNPPSGIKEYYFGRLNKDIDRLWETKIGGNVYYGGIYKDGKDNLISTSGVVTVLDKESGTVLGTSTVETNAGYYTTRSSLPSITKNGDYYVFVQNKKSSPLTLENYIYKYKGKNIEVVKPCPLGFYCNSTPKHNPVILIHGLGGHYQNFMDEKTGVLRSNILQDYRSDDPEFPDSWAYSYSYGYNFGGSYNYQGKIEDISSNLHFDIERLSTEHILAGGDGKVDLIGYSLGGLIARHYILEKTGYPGVQNLDVDTKVRKVIFIASPVNGSSVLQSAYDFKTNHPALGTEMFNFINSTFSSWQHEDIDVTTEIGTQLNTESAYLESISNYYFPNSINFYRNYADIKAKYGYSIFDKEITREVNLGDIIVYPNDTLLKNSTYVGDYRKELNVGLLLNYNNGKLDFQHDLLQNSIKFNHLDMPSNQEVINSVLGQLKE